MWDVQAIRANIDVILRTHAAESNEHLLPICCKLIVEFPDVFGDASHEVHQLAKILDPPPVPPVMGAWELN